MPHLYPKNYAGEAVKAHVVDRTPTPQQIENLKEFVDTKLDKGPVSYDDLMELVEKRWQHRFTTSELKVIFDEMNASRDPERVAQAVTVAPDKEPVG
jgi:hypothetical protein